MDDDTKTLLVILALVYGSSNGMGLLFKDALNEVKTRADNLKAVDRGLAAAQYVRNLEKKVSRSLWSPRVIGYIVLVLAPAAFLAVVVWRGPHEVLTLLGITTSTTSTPAPSRPSPFYWLLLILVLLTTLHLLSRYLAAWGTLIGSWRKRP